MPKKKIEEEVSPIAGKVTRSECKHQNLEDNNSVITCSDCNQTLN